MALISQLPQLYTYTKNKADRLYDGYDLGQANDMHLKDRCNSFNDEYDPRQADILDILFFKYTIPTIDL